MIVPLLTAPAVEH